MELLQKYLFIPLDIFRENKHNGNRRDKKDAWLALLSSDDPDEVIELIEEYPEFRQIYKEAYDLCLHVEKVMDMFSKELYELDKNTVQYMIDEMQETIDEQKEKLGEQQSMINAQEQKIDEMQKQGIRNTIKILQNLKVPVQEIKAQVCKQYQISEEQTGEYFEPPKEK